MWKLMSMMLRNILFALWEVKPFKGKKFFFPITKRGRTYNFQKLTIFRSSIIKVTFSLMPYLPKNILRCFGISQFWYILFLPCLPKYRTKDLKSFIIYIRFCHLQSTNIYIIPFFFITTIIMIPIVWVQSNQIKWVWIMIL